MRISIEIDEELLAEARAVSGAGTAEATVRVALEELIRRGSRGAVLGLRGAGWEGDRTEFRLGRNV